MIRCNFLLIPLSNELHSNVKIMGRIIHNYSSASSSSTACHFRLFILLLLSAPSFFTHCLYTHDDDKQPDDDIYDKVLIGDGNKPRTAPLSRRRAPQFSNQPPQHHRPRQQHDPRRPAPAPKVVAPANRLPSYPAFYSRSAPVRQLNRAV